MQMSTLTARQSEEIYPTSTYTSGDLNTMCQNKLEKCIAEQQQSPNSQISQVY